MTDLGSILTDWGTAISNAISGTSSQRPRDPDPEPEPTPAASDYYDYASGSYAPADLYQSGPPVEAEPSRDYELPVWSPPVAPVAAEPSRDEPDWYSPGPTSEPDVEIPQVDLYPSYTGGELWGSVADWEPPQPVVAAKPSPSGPDNWLVKLASGLWGQWSPRLPQIDTPFDDWLSGKSPTQQANAQALSAHREAGPILPEYALEPSVLDRLLFGLQPGEARPRSPGEMHYRTAFGTTAFGEGEDSRAAKLLMPEDTTWGRTLRATVGSQTEAAANALEFVGLGDVAGPIREWAQGEVEKYQDQYPELSPEALTDPYFWQTTALSSVASSVPLMATGLLLSASAPVIGGAGVLATLARAAVQYGGPAAVTRAIESLLESGGTYGDARKQGKSDEEASEAARTTFVGNMALLPLDALQLRWALKGLNGSTKTALVNGLAEHTKQAPSLIRRILGIGLDTLTEAGEEGYQSAVGQVALGEDVKPDWTSMFLGGLMGSAHGLAGTAVDAMQRAAAPAPAPEVLYQEGEAATPEAQIARAQQAMATRPVGIDVEAYGPDPNLAYQFRYRVVDLDDLIASHDDSLQQRNPAFPEEFQPRERDRKAAVEQVRRIVDEFVARSYLSDIQQWDKGPMIVSPAGEVESGNARTLALRKLRNERPDAYLEYQRQLREILPEYGLTTGDIAGIANPVLVRERVTPLTPEQRREFVRLANEQGTLAMSPFETALSDATRLADNAVLGITVGESQSVDRALRMAANRPLVDAFVAALPENERAAVVDRNGDLNPTGYMRLKSAILAKTFPGQAGRTLAETFTESVDSGIRNIENGLFASLPSLARAEALIRAGEREAGLSISEDLAKAVNVLARLKEQGLTAEKYLRQSTLWERELDEFQGNVLLWLEDSARSPKVVREVLGDYAVSIVESPNPAQGTLFAVDTPTKEALFERAVSKQRAAEEAEYPLFARAAQVTAPGQEGQGLATPSAPAALGEVVPPIPSPEGGEVAPPTSEAPTQTSEAPAQTSAVPVATTPVVEPEIVHPRTRAELRQQMLDSGMVSSEQQADYNLALMAGNAQYLGVDPDAYVDRFIAGIVKGGTPGKGYLPQIIGDAHPYIDQAKATFGLTDNIAEAGYITPTGKMISLSGGQRGKRGLPHEAVGSIVKEQGHQAVHSFLVATGSVRVIYEPDWQEMAVEIAGPLSTDQRRAIMAMADDDLKRLIIDVVDPRTGMHLKGILIPDPSRTLVSMQLNEAARTLEKVGVLFQADYAPTFYSHLQRTVEGISQPRFSAEQLRGMLKKAGVKEEELKWTFTDDLVRQRAVQGKPITKAELLAHLAQNKVEVREVVNQSNPVEGALRERLESIDAELVHRGYSVEDDDFVIDVVTGERVYEAPAEVAMLVDEHTGILEQLYRGKPRFAQGDLITPGGQNQRELLLTLPETPVDTRERTQLEARRDQLLAQMNSIELRYPRVDWFGVGNNLNDPVGVSVRDISEWDRFAAEVGSISRRLDDMPTKAAYRSSHWDEPNVLAHVRFNERTDADGKRVLFVEEVQSDWHQAGREKGYKPANAEEELGRLREEKAAVLERLHNAGKAGMSDAEWQALNNKVADYEARIAAAKNGVPSAPFAKTWPELVMKRTLRWASENGFDKVAWTTGKMQADRYDLAQYVDSLTWRLDAATGRYAIAGIKSESAVIVKEGLSESELADTVGKEIATRIVTAAQTDSMGYITGSDLSVGGQGMLTFYDKMLPEMANRLGKKFGARVGETQIATGEGAETATVPSLDITPAMRKSVLEEGQPLFQKEGKPRASIEWTKDGKALIRALHEPNASSLPHELAHLFRRTLKTEDMAVVARWVGVKGDVRGKWTANNENKFARGFELYLREGKAPTEELKSVFEAFKQWLTEVYRAIKGSPIDVDLTPEVRNVFRKMLGGEAERIEAEAASVAAPVEGAVGPETAQAQSVPQATEPQPEPPAATEEAAQAEPVGAGDTRVLSDSPDAQARLDASVGLTDEQRVAIGEAFDRKRAEGDTRPAVEVMDEAMGEVVVFDHLAAQLGTNPNLDRAGLSQMTQADFLKRKDVTVWREDGRYLIKLPGEKDPIDVNRMGKPTSKEDARKILHLSAVRRAMRDARTGDPKAPLGVPPDVLRDYPTAVEEEEDWRRTEQAKQRRATKPTQPPVAQPPAQQPPAVTPPSVPPTTPPTTPPGPAPTPAPAPAPNPQPGPQVQPGTQTQAPPNPAPAPGPTPTPAPGPVSGDRARATIGLAGNEIELSRPFWDRAREVWDTISRYLWEKNARMGTAEGLAEQILGRSLSDGDRATIQAARSAGAALASDTLLDVDFLPIVRPLSVDEQAALNVFLMTMDQVDKAAVMQNPNRHWSYGTDPARIAATLDEILNGVDPVHLQNTLVDMERRLGSKVFQRMDMRKFAKLTSGLGPEGLARVKAAADQIYAYRKMLLQARVEAGLTSQEEYNFFVNQFPHFSPIRIRKYTEARQRPPGGQRMSVPDRMQPHLTEEGTEAEQIGPLQGYVSLTRQTVSLAFRNEVARKFAAMARIPGMQRIVRPVSEEYDPVNGEVAFYAWDKGERQRFVVPREWGPAVTWEDAATADSLGLISMVLTAPLKMGATGRNILFLPRNMTGDLLDAAVRAGVTPAQYKKAMQDVMSKGPYEEFFLKGGGGMEGWHGVKSVADEAKAFRAEIEPVTTGKRLRQIILGILSAQPVAEVGQRIELTPRVATFYKDLTPAQRMRIELAPVARLDRRAQILGRYPELAADAERTQGEADAARYDLYLSWLGETGLPTADFVALTAPQRAVEIANLEARLSPQQQTALVAGPMRLMEIPAPAIVSGRRVTMDFHRGGIWTLAASRFIPYFNSTSQSPVQLVRSFYEQSGPQGAILRLAAYIILPAVLAEVWNSLFPEYEDVPEYIKDRSVVLMLPWSGQKKDRFGNPIPEAIEIPMRAWAPITMATREALRHVRKTNPEMWQSFVEATLARWMPDKVDEASEAWSRISPLDVGSLVGRTGLALSPLQGTTGEEIVTGLLPPLPVSILEMAINKDFYRNRKIVPSEREFLPASEQYTQWTGEFAILLGKQLGWSPAKIEHFVVANFAGVGRQALQSMDEVVKATGQVRTPRRSPQVGEQIFGWWVPKQGEPELLPADQVETLRQRAKDGEGALYVIAAKNEDRAKSAVYARDFIDTVGVEYPVTSIFFLGGLLATMYRTQGGQLEREKDKAADLVQGTGTAEQTKQAWGRLVPEFQRIKEDQAKLDARKEAGKLSAEEWKDERGKLQQQKSDLLNGVNLVLPLASITGDRRQQYEEARATLAGKLPSDQDRIEVLSQIYMSIEPAVLPDGETDWTEYFAARKDFLASLPEMERAQVKTRARKNATSMEAEYNKARDEMEQYLAIPKEVNGKYNVERGKYWDNHPLLDQWFGTTAEVKGTVGGTPAAAASATAISVVAPPGTPKATAFWQIKNDLEEKIDAYYDAGAAQPLVDAYKEMSKEERAAFKKSDPQGYGAVMDHYDQRNLLLEKPENLLLAEYMAFLDRMGGTEQRDVVEKVTDKSTVDMFALAVLKGLALPGYASQPEPATKTAPATSATASTGATAKATGTPAGVTVVFPEGMSREIVRNQVRNDLQRRLDTYYDAGAAQDLVDTYGAMSTAERTAYRKANPQAYQAIKGYYDQRDTMLEKPENALLAEYMRFYEDMGARDHRIIVEDVTGKKSLDIFVEALIDGKIKGQGLNLGLGTSTGEAASTTSKATTGTQTTSGAKATTSSGKGTTTKATGSSSGGATSKTTSTSTQRSSTVTIPGGRTYTRADYLAGRIPGVRAPDWFSGFGSSWAARFDGGQFKGATAKVGVYAPTYNPRSAAPARVDYTQKGKTTPPIQVVSEIPAVQDHFKGRVGAYLYRGEELSRAEYLLLQQMFQRYPEGETDFATWVRKHAARLLGITEAAPIAAV